MAGELINQTADAIEEVAVDVEKVALATRRLSSTNIGFAFTGFGIGIAAGFAAGYFIAEHRLKTKYSKLAYDEIGRMREHYYAKERANQNKPPLNEIVVEETVVHERPTRPPVVVDEPRRSRAANVFEENEEWNYEEEIRARTPDVPYIIHIDEFRENEPVHEQYTYKYYEVDDVLADDRDRTIDDMDAVIGLGNLGRWGHGSNDDNLVYIRNERLSSDYEVIRDRGSYTDQVQGTIRHSADRRRNKPNRKFDDER